MVLELAQRVAIEFGVAADVALGIDERDPVTDTRAELTGEVGPAERIGGQEGGEDARLMLEAARDFVLEIVAQ